MFDFDVVTGPTPPLCKLPEQDDPAPAAEAQKQPAGPQERGAGDAQPLRR